MFGHASKGIVVYEYRTPYGTEKMTILLVPCHFATFHLMILMHFA